MTWVRLWRAENSNHVNNSYGGDHDDYDHDDYDRDDEEDGDGNDEDCDEDSQFYGGWFVSWEGGIFSLLKIPPLAY